MPVRLQTERAVVDARRFVQAAEFLVG